MDNRRHQDSTDNKFWSRRARVYQKRAELCVTTCTRRHASSHIADAITEWLSLNIFRQERSNAFYQRQDGWRTHQRTEKTVGGVHHTVDGRIFATPPQNRPWSPLKILPKATGPKVRWCWQIDRRPKFQTNQPHLRLILFSEGMPPRAPHLCNLNILWYDYWVILSFE